MISTRALAGFAAGALLLSGCSAPALAPAKVATGAAATPSAPVNSVPPSGSIEVVSFVDQMVKANDSLNTFTVNTTMGFTEAGKESSMSSSGVIDQTDRQHKNMQLKVSVAGQTVELVVVDGDYFLDLAGAWYKLSKSAAAQYTKSVTVDVTSWAEESKSSIEKVELVGEESVNGVATRHYRMTMNGDALKDLGGTTDTEVASFDYEVWLDADNHLRKYAMDIESGKTPVSMVGTMDDINEPVSITAPEKFTTMPG
ncbi:MAG: LppX_LprAFG lipoprotein [Propionicimonas sp.]